MKCLEFLPSEIFKKKYLLSLIPRPARGGWVSAEHWIKLWTNERW
jgi:hypothetical protein